MDSWAVAHRAGRKIALRFDTFSRCRTVKSACDHWAGRLQERLAEMRTRHVGK